MDVQLLKPDGSDEEQAPVIPDVEIPTWWAGPDRGIFCLPVVGAIVRVAWDYGDPACPLHRFDAWLWLRRPAHLLGALVIQHSKDCFVTIDPETNIIVQHDPETKVVIDKERNIAVLTPENETHEVKKTFAVKCQQALVECEKVAQVRRKLPWLMWLKLPQLKQAYSAISTLRRWSWPKVDTRLAVAI